MKKRQIPHTYVIIFYIILFCAALTWIIPGGQYTENISPDGERTVVYESVESVRSISRTCETREDVLAWICKHQLGRRNLTPEQKKFLIGKQYHSEKSTRGGNHGNQYTQVANCQIDNLPSVENTTERIAKENNVSPSFVIRAEQFMKTVELMEKYCPGIQEEILSGKLKLSQREATIIRGTPTEALPTA